MRKTQKKAEQQWHANYKNLISQYYARDPWLSDTYDKLKPVFPEIEILQTLHDFEKKLDEVIKMKRFDVQEMFVKPAQKLKRVLRVYVTYEKKETEDVLKLFGQIYPNNAEAATFVDTPKFTSFFKQISFALSSEGQPFETWRKPTSGFQQHDGFVLKLPKSNEESTYNIKFSMINNPPKFQVESSLQRIVGMKKGTRVAILDAFWSYVKENKLQDVENKQIINCDEKLKNTFKIEKFAFATVNSRIRELLVPLDPIGISIKPSDGKKIFDFVVEVEERPDVDIVPFFSQKINEEKNQHQFLTLNAKIKKYQKKFNDHSEKLRRHLAKKHLYENFTPENIEAIINEQNQLLKVLRKERPAENFEKLEFILENEEQVEKQIKHYYEQLNLGGSFPLKQ